uniref:Uncharacterized protein n=1 Tax=Astyanax mexicanus TaxID=7994 RepID=A0A8B9JYQ8_ASTMX
MPRSSCAVYGTAITGVILIVTGVALLVAGVFQNIINKRLKGEITLTEGSKVFGTWKNPPPPVFMEFFFYNVTNPKEFMEGKKPRVNTMGPYTYRYAVMNKLKESNFWVRSFMSVLMGSLGTMFFTHTVNELLWGFEDPLLSRLHKMKPEVDGKFGLMLDKNGSTDGEFVYFTGEQNYLEYGRIDTWKGQKLMSFWNTNQSNMINGTDGSAFHPFLTKEERLDVFTADLCRSIHMLFEKEVKVKGIPAYRYTPPRAVLASGKNNPENEGFCLDPANCLDDGVLNVAVCRKGAPVIVSFPHFYLGDKKYADAIDGLSPVHEHHQTYLDLNPTTGVPVRAAKRAQINILLDRVSGFPMTRNLNGTVFPVMFLNEVRKMRFFSQLRKKKYIKYIYL